MAGLLHQGFLRSVAVGPDRTALEVDGQSLTYRRLFERAGAFGATLQRRMPTGGSPFVGVFAHRSPTAFAGMLAALMAGRGYVPLNRTFPVERTRWMLRNANCRSLIVDSGSRDQLDSILAGAVDPMLILVPDENETGDLADRWPEHVVVGRQELESPGSWRAASASEEAIAYLLFTSGSTGTPKGVTVRHRNATHFLDAMVRRFGIAATDRFSQMFDATFDLSIFDTFLAWQQGACVCCPSEKALFNPDRFIREEKITVWASVPSAALLMKRFGVLKANRYPSLRLSVFCGEPLPQDLARAWAAAAPQSVLENLYGPTELTVACTAYRWNEQTSVAESELGLVPIGQPWSGLEALVVDEGLCEVSPGEVGELLMSGAQVSAGYWQNLGATRRAFVVPPGRTSVFYRTGDRVRRPLGDGPLLYIGRVDHQIKIFGHRVELGEVESTLRCEPGVDGAVAIGWPTTASGAAGVVAFLTGRQLDVSTILASVKSKLQDYAVPHTIHILSEMPQTDNGKIDRQALRHVLEG